MTVTTPNRRDPPTIWAPRRSEAAPCVAEGEARWTGPPGLTINRPLPALAPGHAQVAQLVEHATENRSVGGSIPPLGTIEFNHLADVAPHLKITVSALCPH